ncbi:class I adenylate-forming enzyme family protein [Streptomyces scabichelini]|uniref:class I adenylate-forming enzyme family protein n=1 Tax=Streptomyces scabichelini TaxID=2711217 RepID=UPI0030B9CF78
MDDVVSPGGILRHAVTRYGDKVALVTTARSMTFRELDAESDRIAAALAARGVRPGQPVSLYAQNRWEWVVAYHGALKAGAVVNPVNVMLTSEELAFVLRDCAAAAVFTSSEQAAGVLSLTRDLPGLGMVVAFDDPPEGAVGFAELLTGDGPVPAFTPDPAAPSTIGYTSGTTGHPKGAVQSHRAVLLNCALTATMHGRTSTDVVVTALPAPHVYGNVVVNSTFLAGGTVVLMERFDPGEALRLIGEHSATMFEGVPAMYAMMLAHPALEGADLSSLTRCTVGGQTIPLSTIERWQARSGAPLIELWGMTEIAGLGITHALHSPAVPGSIGVSLPGVEVRIAELNDVKRDAPRGEPGELMVRGPIVMLGYHGNPQATAEAIEPDGWLHTGDIASMTDTGHVFIVDRRKDMIITGGYNVYPAEIERVLAAHPAVAMVAVGPVADPVKGELACAYVVLAPGRGATEEELIEFAGRSLAAYKRPRMVRFVDDLPKTSTGKVMRRELIKAYGQ